MKVPAVLSFCSLLVTPAAVLAEQAPGPVTQPTAAEISIDPSPAGRRLIRLPGAEFPLRLAPVCPSGLEFDSLSISVADTRKNFGAADFGAETVLETSLRIPGRQIGPVAVDKFCAAAADSPASMNIADALTAHVATRCSNASEQAVNYDAFALEILLICNSRDEPAEADSASAAEQPAGENQDSPSPTRF